jgi:hypothetical protein
MNEEERERTMNFILEQQAHFAAGMERFEVGMQRLRRDLALMAVQFRRERKDLRERISALADAQIKSEDKSAGWQDRLTRIEALTERNSEAILRNSEDIRALTNYVARDGGKQKGGADEG